MACEKFNGVGSNPDLAEGIDCFADGNSDNWKLCGSSDIPSTWECVLETDKPLCKTDTCQLPPWIKGEGGYDAGTCNGKLDTNPATNKPYGCHGNCDVKSGVCTYNTCSNKALAHVNSDELGYESVSCTATLVPAASKNAPAKFSYSSSSSCPFKNDADIGYFATCVKYNSACNSATQFCLGQVTCHISTTGAVADCADADDAESGIELWDGIDCIVQKNSASTSAGFLDYKICHCGGDVEFGEVNGKDKYNFVTAPY